MTRRKTMLLKYKELVDSYGAGETKRKGAPKMKVFLTMCMKTKDGKISRWDV
jgi:hypothetical protein